jgi:hypothetical protein
VLTRIFLPIRDEVTGRWRKLHNGEVHNFDSSDIIRMIKSKKMRWVGHVGEMRNANKISVRNPEEKRQLGRPKHRCENNIKMDLRRIGLERVNQIHVAQDRGPWRP